MSKLKCTANFYITPHGLEASKDLTPTEKAILKLIYSYQKENDILRYGDPRIGKLIGRSAGTVSNNLTKLNSKGLIIRHIHEYGYREIILSKLGLKLFTSLKNEYPSSKSEPYSLKNEYPSLNREPTFTKSLNPLHEKMNTPSSKSETYNNNNNFNNESNRQNSLSSFKKNNSLESEQPQSPQPEQRANKPQPLQSYLNTISNNITNKEEQRGATVYSPTTPSGLNASEIGLWEETAEWSISNLAARGIKTTFKDIFMAYLADCKGKGVNPSKQGVLGWVKREDDRNYKEPQKYNPRSPTPNASIPNQPKQLTDEELAQKEETKKKASEVAESVARSRHAAQIVKENPDYFADFLKLPIYKRQTLLSEAGCTKDYYSKEIILQKLKDINYGR